MKKISLMVLVILLLLPRMLYNVDDDHYEVILDQPQTISSKVIEQSSSKPDHVAFLSEITTTTIQGHSLSLVHTKGDLSTWINKKQPSMTFEQNNRIWLTKKSSQQLFFTENSTNNEMTLNNQTFIVEGIIDPYDLTFNKKIDGFISTSDDTTKIKRIYIKGTLKNDYLSSLGVTNYTIHSLKKLHQTTFKEMIFFESVILLILLIITIKKYVLGKDASLIPWFVIFFILLIRIPYAHWPLELINEKLVSLTAYINGIKTLPMNLYNFLSKDMSLMVFQMKLIILIQPIYYFIIGKNIMKGFKQ